jgi:hypothetical protein
VIYHKVWHRSTRRGLITYQYDGWFLLGVLPLYVTRHRI